LFLYSFMARPEGFEPPTPWFVGSHSYSFFLFLINKLVIILPL